MNPGVLISDIGHLEEVFVESGIDKGFLEQGFMGVG
jgi:hypothetical protein